MTLIGLFLFLLASLIVIIAGALQCFAPRMYREIQKRFRVKADWSAGAGGKFFEDLTERNAENPSVSYRVGGLGLMIFGFYMLYRVIGRLMG
jgi:uncharacterized protein YjeT (DUF2065 family)